MNPEKSPVNFAKAYAELEAIVRGFESGKVDLDDGLKQFERGLLLAKQLKARLREVEQKVETIKQKFDAETPDGEPAA